MSHEGSRQARDRGVTRSKAEKARPPTQPVPQVDIVPGRLNEAEWIAFTSLEEGEDVVGDILADLLARVMECVFKVYLTQQEPGDPDQFLSGSPWSDRESQEPTQSSEPSESRGTRGPTPIFETSQEAEPEDALEEPDGQESSHTLAVSSKESLQTHTSARSSKESLVAHAHSRQPSLGLPQAGPPAFSVKELYQCLLQPDGAGDRSDLAGKGRPRAFSSGSVSLLRALTPEWNSGSPQSDRPPSRKMPIVRLDPARLPRRWVRPVAEVLIPDAEVRAFEIYRGRPRRERSQAGARTSAPGPGRGSRAPPRQPLPAPRPALPQRPPFGARGPASVPRLAQSSPPFGAKLPFLSPGFRFLAGNPVPPELSCTASPKLWPRARWPSGWEREAEQLGDLWAGRTRVAAQPEDAAADDASDDSGWPLPVPQVLEPTFQVLWKPMVYSETMKLVPGVSMWNRGTQELLTSAATQEEADAEQQPSQAGVSKPQVIMTPLIKKEAPKA